MSRHMVTYMYSTIENADIIIYVLRISRYVVAYTESTTVLEAYMSIRSDHDKGYGNVQVYNSAGNIQHVSIVWFVHKSKHGGKINSAMDFLYVELYTKHDRVRVVGLVGEG